MLAVETAGKLTKQWYHQPSQLFESEIAVSALSDLGVKLGQFYLSQGRLANSLKHLKQTSELLEKAFAANACS